MTIGDFENLVLQEVPGANPGEVYRALKRIINQVNGYLGGYYDTVECLKNVAGTLTGQNDCTYASSVLTLASNILRVSKVLVNDETWVQRTDEYTRENEDDYIYAVIARNKIRFASSGIVAALPSADDILEIRGYFGIAIPNDDGVGTLLVVPVSWEEMFIAGTAMILRGLPGYRDEDERKRLSAMFSSTLTSIKQQEGMKFGGAEIDQEYDPNNISGGLNGSGFGVS